MIHLTDHHESPFATGNTNAVLKLLKNLEKAQQLPYLLTYQQNTRSDLPEKVARVNEFHY